MLGQGTNVSSFMQEAPPPLPCAALAQARQGKQRTEAVHSQSSQLLQKIQYTCMSVQLVSLSI